MAKETKYGVISDIHGDPNIITKALALLKSQSAEKLLVNGDVGGWQGDLKSSQGYTAFILNKIGENGIEAFVQAGSHEPLLVFEPVLEYFSDKFSNIIDVTKKTKIEHNGHNLVFLPGSDYTCGGEYQIGNEEEIPTGKYIKTRQGLVGISNLGQYVEGLNRKITQGVVHFTNMNDLKIQVSAPEKTVIVCHVPRKFDNIDEAVDMAEFGEATFDFLLQGNLIKKYSIFPLPIAQKINAAGYPVAIKKENRGNKHLRKLYDEIGITKSVTGHFHESSHRANDRNGMHVAENTYVNELFWNSGHLDQGYTGILTVDGEKVKYQNLRIEI